MDEINISFKEMIIVFLTIFLALIMVIPVIYLRNEIYYISRDIQALRIDSNFLQEENKELKNKLEYIRIKHEVLDPLTVDIR